MSIEAKLDAVIAALNANTAALQVVANIQGKAPVAEKPADAKTPLKGTKNTTVITPSTPAANDGALNYEKDVKAPMMALAAAKGRDAVTPIFAAFEVKNALGLSTEQWPAFIAAVAKAAA